MKKSIYIVLVLFMANMAFAQTLKFSVLPPNASLKQSGTLADPDSLFLFQGDVDETYTISAELKEPGDALGFRVKPYESDAGAKGYYSYIENVPSNPGSTLSAKNSRYDIPVTILAKEKLKRTVYTELIFELEKAGERGHYGRKRVVIVIGEKKSVQASDSGNSQGGKKKGQEEGQTKKGNNPIDTSNYTKVEIVQYTDVTGFQNDKPNGLLQFQGFLKIPINKRKRLFGERKNRSYQWFRSLVADVTLNRLDKSKQEVDYDYRSFFIENDKAKRSLAPWLATTDLWRYSNFQFGLRVVPFVLQLGDFRLQFQAGIKVIKNNPYSIDTININGKDTAIKFSRSVYSSVKYLEFFARNYDSSGLQVSFNAGIMWLNLMDSYYEQIDILQQNPSNKITALAPISDLNRSKPMWYTSLRLGAGLGKDKVVNTFMRLSYMIQTGEYFRVRGTVVDGAPINVPGSTIQTEKKKFYNSFVQIHGGISIGLDKLFSKGNPKKDDGPVSNSAQ